MCYTFPQPKVICMIVFICYIVQIYIITYKWCASRENTPWGLCRCHTQRRIVGQGYGYDTDYKILLCQLHRLYSVVGVVPKEILAGLQPANPSVGMTMTKTLRSVFSWRVSNMPYNAERQLWSFSFFDFYKVVDIQVIEKLQVAKL